MTTAHKQLMNNAVDLVVEIPEHFSSILQNFSEGISIGPRDR